MTNSAYFFLIAVFSLAGADQVFRPGKNAIPKVVDIQEYWTAVFALGFALHAVFSIFLK